MDDLIVFYVVFGKSVPNISISSVAKLGYAEGLLSKPVYPEDTLRSRSEVDGVRQNYNGKSGNV